MYKRIRKIKNSCGDTRIIKIAKENAILEISSNSNDVSIVTGKEQGEEYIKTINFVCGPVIEIGSYINLLNYGRCKVIGIYPSFNDNPNEYLLETLKLNGKEKRR